MDTMISTQQALPPCVVTRLGHLVPSGVPVVPGSTPVLSFGPAHTELPWLFVANSRGTVNNPMDIDAAPATDWYCYTISPLEVPVTV
jgi:hypothetical protein